MQCECYENAKNGISERNLKKNQLLRSNGFAFRSNSIIKLVSANHSIM